MLSISRPSWGYGKIKTQVPRPWQTTPLQHQCVVTSISSPTTEASPAAAFVFYELRTSSPAHLTIQTSRHVLFLRCHNDAHWLVGGDCICPAAIRGGAASSCKCSRLPPQVSARSGSDKWSSDIVLGNEGFCKFKQPEDPDRIAYRILLILITGLPTGVTARFS